MARCRRLVRLVAALGEHFRRSVGGRHLAAVRRAGRPASGGAIPLFKRKDSGCEGRSPACRLHSPAPHRPPPPFPSAPEERRRQGAESRAVRHQHRQLRCTGGIRERGAIPFRAAVPWGGSGRGGKLLPFLQQAQELLNWPHLEGLSSSHLFHQVPLPQQSHGIRETTGSRITPLPAPPALAALRLLSALSRCAPGITGGSITVICHRGEGRG